MDKQEEQECSCCGASRVARHFGMSGDHEAPKELEIRHNVVPGNGLFNAEQGRSWPD
jgi:hypothetical protein